MPRKEKKSRKSKRRRRDSPTPSHSSSDGETRKKRKTEKLAKKVQKHLKKYQGKLSGYNNEDNIFNDPNLSERFVWKKKLEKQIDEGVSLNELGAKSERARQEDRLKEIEKVKKAREEREAEQARQQEELSMIERARYAAEASEAATKEEEFLLSQAMMSSRLRVRSGRMEPIDFIARNLDPELVVENERLLEPPYSIFSRLNLDEMKKLLEGIKQFKDLDKHDEVHVEFWQCMHEIARHELMMATQQDILDRAKIKGESQSNVLKEEELHVEDEVQLTMAGKSFSELCDLEKQLTQMVEDSEGGDPEYWERVLNHLKIHKVCARVRMLQNAIVEKHMDSLRKAMQEEAEEKNSQEQENEDEDDEDEEDFEKTDSPGPGPSSAVEKYEGLKNVAQKSAIMENEFSFEIDDRFSPEPLDLSEISGKEVIAEEEDLQNLEILRRQVRLNYSDRFRHAADMAAAAASLMSASDRAYQAMILDPARHPSGVHPMLRHITDPAPQGDDPLAFRSGRGMSAVDEEDPILRRLHAESLRKMGSGDGDMPFGGEVKLESRVYWWHEKYRPRKPKYFNRVHTGYEWNKYNQTHYDHDNPPPKVVQGYKFNIFYPDLMDKKQPPTYSFENDASSKDGSTCMLRFKAGPPYEDIAFRIVNKEWEYSHKKGFKCTFERGILHLYFNFKRQRYRR